MATSKNLSPGLSESGRMRMKGLLEMTLFIFGMCHLSGGERVRSGEEQRAGASPGPRQM